MSEKIDIVRRLRLEANAMGEFSTYASREYSRLLLDSVEEIERLRAERDEARREERDEARRLYLASTCSEDEIIHEMKRHGWDCFRENTDYLQDLG